MRQRAEKAPSTGTSSKPLMVHQEKNVYVGMFRDLTQVGLTK